MDETLLHYAATYVNIKSLRVLLRFDLNNINVYARTLGFEDYFNNYKIKGQTVLKTIIEREGVSSE